MRAHRLLALLVATAAVTQTVLLALPRTPRAASAARLVSQRARVQAQKCPIPRAQRRAFVRASTSTGIPLALLTAIAQTESRFDPTAVSKAGAVGVMQVLPQTARSFGLDASDESENVLAAAKYLAYLFQTLPSADLAVAAYNAGPSAVATAAGALSGETTAYVASVDDAWTRLEGCT